MTNQLHAVPAPVVRYNKCPFKKPSSILMTGDVPPADACTSDCALFLRQMDMATNKVIFAGCSLTSLAIHVVQIAQSQLAAAAAAQPAMEQPLAEKKS